MTSPLDRAEGGPPLPLPGLEADNLLAFLAMLGLLRALEMSRPDWHPRASWHGRPWRAHLHLAVPATEDEIAAAAGEGAKTISAAFEIEDSPGEAKKNVDFDAEEFRAFARASRDDGPRAALAAVLAAEFPRNRKDKPQASPFVMMFGQGHQNFLDRFAAVPAGKLPERHTKVKKRPDFAAPGMIADALFRPWRREDDADGFRWDPEDDQRYALRYDDPSRPGAAGTVHGANRLAAIGLLSCAVAPRERRSAVIGAERVGQEWTFVWPIWSEPMALAGVEALLAHPGLGKPDGGLSRLGVFAIMRARRVPNGKFMNVTRAVPVAAP